MEKIVIKVPKSKIRNPFALDALMRRGGRMRNKREKRKNNPKRKDWD